MEPYKLNIFLFFYFSDNNPGLQVYWFHPCVIQLVHCARTMSTQVAIQNQLNQIFEKLQQRGNLINRLNDHLVQQNALLVDLTTQLDLLETS